ncbi:hypothetical protein GCM10011534_12250 [Pseudooceanicola nanhaiensis]|jgi:hypothetical protein|uniref:DUF3168 domain-containing protein n=1 Tax=Pseudooceanicola nanhaiensis TaxID=375761 RepID=A0A917WBI8_9RHOB|nr:DUF3168 domain-containing protein [Pseudooceanicola nanhaiensis]GGL91643.1 hypothetical protein GCM10011534_12250 [Pseudooceanicola nanhaiensis]
MADGYALELQKALVAALKSSADVSALVAGRIYDHPPDGASLPYIRIGGIVPRPVRAQASRAAILTYSMEVHSRSGGSGRVEATKIGHAVTEALNEREDALASADLAVVQNHWITTTVERNNDGETYSAIVAFEALISG